jgi:hypothetical protein
MHGVCRIRRKGRLALKDEAIILKGLVSKVQRPKFSHFETFREMHIRQLMAHFPRCGQAECPPCSEC